MSLKGVILRPRAPKLSWPSAVDDRQLMVRLPSVMR